MKIKNSFKENDDINDYIPKSANCLYNSRKQMQIHISFT